MPQNHLIEKAHHRQRCYFRALFRAWLRVFAILSLVPLRAFGADVAVAQQRPPVSEYELKAAILYNLTRFVEWPASAYADAQAPTVLCILGRDPFGTFLDSLTSKETVNGRPVQVRRLPNTAELHACHVLYISSSERRSVPQIFESLKGSNVLTVGEMAMFAKRGGMVQFELEEKQVHFDINLDASLHADLKISARLLVLAKIVKSGAPENARPGD
jgi:YfiR/HmsC-like